MNDVPPRVVEDGFEIEGLDGEDSIVENETMETSEDEGFKSGDEFEIN